MSVALRSSAPVRPSLRRTASLENFLDKNRGEDQIELRTTTLDNKEGVTNNVASNKPGMPTNTTFLLLTFSQLTLALKEAKRPSKSFTGRGGENSFFPRPGHWFAFQAWKCKRKEIKLVSIPWTKVKTGLVEGGSLIKSNPEGVRRQLGLDHAPTKRLLPELAGNPLKGQSLTFTTYSLPG